MAMSDTDNDIKDKGNNNNDDDNDNANGNDLINHHRKIKSQLFMFSMHYI